VVMEAVKVKNKYVSVCMYGCMCGIMTDS